MVSPFMTDAEKHVAVRAALPALGSGIYLNAGSVGPLPAEVAAAMTELAAYERDIGRASLAYLELSLERAAEARAAAAAVIGADLEAMTLTHAVTEGMNIVTAGLDWAPGDLAVTTMHEHPGALGPLIAARDRHGVELVFADVGDGGDDERTLAAFEAAIRLGTRLVSFSHVLWTTGAVLPVTRIAALAHQRGALVAVDGAQAVGALPVHVEDLGVDAYAVAGQKWLLGPEGTGALWVSPAVRDRVRPTYAGWYSFASIDTRGDATWHADGRRYESLNVHRPSITGFARAIGWLSMFVGLEYVHRAGPANARRAAERLSAVPGVELVTPLDRMATLVTFRIDGWTPDAALEELGARIFLIARTIPALDALRLSVGFFTSDDEIDRVVEAVRFLAAHTPATLPPRRGLPILGEA